MPESSVSDEALAEFRFQSFYEDVIEAAAPQDAGSRLERRRRTIVNDPEILFMRGELREAVGIAALGVAAGVFPREPFTRMLEYGDIPGLVAGYFDPESADPGNEVVPYPIYTLPDKNYALILSDLDMGEDRTNAVPEMVATYASLMRQVHRASYQRRFNAELLFASAERWQSAVKTFADSTRAWFDRRVDIGDAIWLPDGLDSYFDLAEDLGASVLLRPSGDISEFRVTRALTENGVDNIDIVLEAILSRSLLPFTAWRFGGASGGDLALLVVERTNGLQELVSSVSRGIYTEAGWPVRSEIRAWLV